MDSILKFALIDILEVALDDALVQLRRAFNKQLGRFSEEMDMTWHAEALLRIATEALGAKLAESLVMLASKANKKVVEMPVRTPVEIRICLRRHRRAAVGRVGA